MSGRTHAELKSLIKCIHKQWYEEDWIDDPSAQLKLHRHMSELFNYAGITSSLVENNPGEMTIEKFKELTGATE